MNDPSTATDTIRSTPSQLIDGMTETPASQRRRCEVCGADGVIAHLVERSAPGERGGREQRDLSLKATLCQQHSERLLSRVAHWLAAMAATEGHHVSAGRRLRDGEAASLIRAWAVKEGYPVGRTSLSTQVITAYRAAHAQVAQER